MSESEADFVQAALSDDEEIYKTYNTKSGSVLVVAGEQPRQYRLIVVDSKQKDLTELYIENIRTAYSIQSDVSLLDRLRGFKRLELLLEGDGDSSDVERMDILGNEEDLIELRTEINDLILEEQAE